MENLTKDDIKIAILKELAEANKELHKLNLLGNHPDRRGPLEHRLGVTFDKSRRALAARAFDEVKQEGLTEPQYKPGQVDAENWVEITDAGRRVLQTGVLDLRLRAADSSMAGGVSKFGPPDHSSFQNRMSVIEPNQELVSVLFFDLDSFKSVNDNHNHSVGDQVIREAMAVVERAIKGKGELFHRSGDEMLILLANFSQDEACSVAERIRRGIEEYSFSTIGQGLITATIGVSTYPHTCSQFGELEVAADTAMLEAKKRGKNIVLSAPARPSTHETKNNTRLSQSALGLLLGLREELATNLPSVTDATYGQLGRLLDDQYRRIVGESFYVDLPENVKSTLSEAYQAVRNVNDYVENSMHQQIYTPGGTEARNEVLRAKQASFQPLRSAVKELKSYLMESGNEAGKSH